MNNIFIIVLGVLVGLALIPFALVGLTYISLFVQLIFEKILGKP